MSDVVANRPLYVVLANNPPCRHTEPQERWKWQYVFVDCWTIEHDRMAALLEDVRERGIVNPIRIREDGYVDDGHHRIVIAMTLGLPNLPVRWKFPLDIWDKSY